MTMMRVKKKTNEEEFELFLLLMHYHNLQGKKVYRRIPHKRG